MTTKTITAAVLAETARNAAEHGDTVYCAATDAEAVYVTVQADSHTVSVMAAPALVSDGEITGVAFDAAERTTFRPRGNWKSADIGQWFANKTFPGLPVVTP